MARNEVLTTATFEQLFKKSADIKFQTLLFNEHTVTLIICEAMIDLYLLHEVVMPRITQFLQQAEKIDEQTLITTIALPQIVAVTTSDEAELLVYRGHCLICLDELVFVAANIEKKPNRSPEETNLEVTITGPRDNFIEDIATNIALLRKRLPTKSLCVERMELGRRSKTALAIVYFDDIANKESLQQIKQGLAKVDVDIVFSTAALMEMLHQNTKLFPLVDYTGRPDFAMQALARGRFIIFVDGVAYATITPINLLMLLKSGEDNEYPVIFSSFERLIRVFCIGIGVLLPATWLALTTFHQDQLPFPLLATVVQANTGLPLPSSLEMLLMVFMFELLREAGLRLPTIIGSTIGVVGGLIIGDAAIRAGITSPAMVVVIAVSTIAAFTLVNQSLVSAISIVRIFFILMASILGFFGVFISFFIVLLYLANLRVLGVPYLNFANDFSLKNWAKAFLRLPQKQYKKRPKMLHTQDETRKGREDDA
ncbi:MAG: spore germination protein [Solibacillus sp.]